MKTYEELVAAAAAKRSTKPYPYDSFPARAYRYAVAARGKPYDGQENFCRFWRVVLIWSTLWRLKAGLVAGPKVRGKRVSVAPLVAVACTLTVAVVTLPTVVMWGLIVIAGLVYLIFGGLVASDFYHSEIKKDGEDVFFPAFGDTSTASSAVLVLIALPALVVYFTAFFGGWLLLYAVLGTLVYLFDDLEIHWVVVWGLARVLNAHSERFPRLRPWTVLLALVMLAIPVVPAVIYWSYIQPRAAEVAGISVGSLLLIVGGLCLLNRHILRKVDASMTREKMEFREAVERNLCNEAFVTFLRDRGYSDLIGQFTHEDGRLLPGLFGQIDRDTWAVILRNFEDERRMERLHHDPRDQEDEIESNFFEWALPDPVYRALLTIGQFFAFLWGVLVFVKVTETCPFVTFEEPADPPPPPAEAIPADA